MKTVRVFGNIRNSEEDRQKTPAAFLKLFDQMIAFDHKDVHLWEPDKVEIHVIPYTNSEGEPVPWPKGWPDIKDKTTKDMKEYFGRGESYNIYLPGKNKNELEQILFHLKENQAVLMNERQWSVSPWRYCLPGEELWINK